MTKKNTNSFKIELLPVEAAPNRSRFPSLFFHICCFDICQETNTGTLLTKKNTKSYKADILPIQYPKYIGLDLLQLVN